MSKFLSLLLSHSISETITQNDVIRIFFPNIHFMSSLYTMQFKVQTRFEFSNVLVALFLSNMAVKQRYHRSFKTKETTIARLSSINNNVWHSAQVKRKMNVLIEEESKKIENQEICPQKKILLSENSHKQLNLESEFVLWIVLFFGYPWLLCI